MNNKQGTKPTWLYDKAGNIRPVNLPVNANGQTITLNPQAMNGKIPDSVGFSGVGSNIR